jgi:hypothetical protein
MTRSLPSTGFLRLSDIIGNRKVGKPGVLPIGPTTWWNGVKNGRFPKPIKLGPRITAWRVEDIQKLLDEFANG